MEVYFVVLKLPGGAELKFTDGGSPEHFWQHASKTIHNGEAKIVSARTDTGVSEELRSHLSCNCFETYFLFYLMMEKHEIKNHELIFSKANDLLKVGNYEMVIDASDTFQLVTLDYNEIVSPPHNSATGNPLLSA